MMTPIIGNVSNGKIEVAAPRDWPEGCEVIIVPVRPMERIGIQECEWSDDPAALADWSAWIKTIESPELTPEEEAIWADFDDRMKQCNIEATQRNMKAEPLQ